MVGTTSSGVTGLLCLGQRCCVRNANCRDTCRMWSLKVASYFAGSGPTQLRAQLSRRCTMNRVPVGCVDSHSMMNSATGWGYSRSSSAAAALPCSACLFPWKGGKGYSSGSQASSVTYVRCHLQSLTGQQGGVTRIVILNRETRAQAVLLDGHVVPLGFSSPHVASKQARRQPCMPRMRTYLLGKQSATLLVIAEEQ
jgi:hypothetical protein